MDQNEQQLWRMLGEIQERMGEVRGDVKYLVNERSTTLARLEAVEAAHSNVIEKQGERITKLEHFRTKVAALTGALGIGVPTILTVALNKLGLL